MLHEAVAHIFEAVFISIEAAENSYSSAREFWNLQLISQNVKDP